MISMDNMTVQRYIYSKNDKWGAFHFDLIIKKEERTFLWNVFKQNDAIKRV